MYANSQSVSAVIRFGPFDADLQTQELRKHGVRLRLPRQSFQILKMLLERPGSLITREELRQVLWPSDTFVDFDHSLNAAVNRLREVLGDSADEPRLVETLPRRGYRFIGEIALPATAAESADVTQVSTFPPSSEVLPSADTHTRRSALRYSIASLAVALLAGTVLFLIYGKTHLVAPQKQRALTRITFDKGLQFGATWSPDGRFIAYSSDLAGKFDIWVQQVSGGDPVQITKNPGHNWQPEWSPDGKYIAYRSEDGDGGLFVIPALGGIGLARKIVAGGFYPHWSPDSTQILFQTTANNAGNQFYVASLDGSQPREVKTRYSEHPFRARSAAWHPDGKRISVWVMGDGPVPTFWTVPVAGGEGVESEIDPQILRQLADISADFNDSMGRDVKFSWMPSGKAILFECTFRGVRNLWKMSVDPKTLRAHAIERLTVGSGLDTDFAISADGKRIAFTAESDRVQAWIFPFDGNRGRLTGAGTAVTSPGEEAWDPNLSRDGKKLVFNAFRAGKWEFREQSQMGGETPVLADSNYARWNAVWSPDGQRLAYVRANSEGDKNQLVMWSAEGRAEQPLTPLSDLHMQLTDWSSDGKQLLLSQVVGDVQSSQIVAVSAVQVPNSEMRPRVVAAKDGHYLWQPHLSPDGQWVAFLDQSSYFTRFESIVYVTRPTGGPWIRVTDGKFWVDKPRWAPDGKTIYFLSRQSGFYDVWGIRFDLEKGTTVGDSFRVTDFGTPALMIPNDMDKVGLSLTRDKLTLPLTEASGGIWVLNEVDQ